MIIILGIIEPLLVLLRDEYSEEYTNRTLWFGRRTPVFLRNIKANYSGMSICFLPKLRHIVLNSGALKKWMKNVKNIIAS